MTNLFLFYKIKIQKSAQILIDYGYNITNGSFPLRQTYIIMTAGK